MITLELSPGVTRVFEQHPHETDWTEVDLSVDARVLRGAVYLAANYNEGLSTVDVERLDVHRGSYCPLVGASGVSSWLDRAEVGLPDGWTFAHGFGCVDWAEAAPVEVIDHDDDVDALNAAWRNAIARFQGDRDGAR